MAWVLEVAPKNHSAVLDLHHKKQWQDNHTTPTDAVISLALFCHQQSLNKPINRLYPTTCVVEVILGFLHTQNGVNLERRGMSPVMTSCKL